MTNPYASPTNSQNPEARAKSLLWEFISATFVSTAIATSLLVVGLWLLGQAPERFSTALLLLIVIPVAAIVTTLWLCVAWTTWRSRYFGLPLITLLISAAIPYLRMRGAGV
jgi:hypothetical protein